MTYFVDGTLVGGVTGVCERGSCTLTFAPEVTSSLGAPSRRTLVGTPVPDQSRAPERRSTTWNGPGPETTAVSWSS
ncbi:hypothetical protein [Actinokineospora globicatena]|uniref:hypothetical protein n=1 Tax=Actinokineospora globicatena TaxID=103729 RepID=UPI0020A31D85|nr:hypothetical protein [Actinokineospora globicatena]